MRKLDARGEPIPNTTYTLLPGVVTRGREPAPGEPIPTAFRAS